MAVLLTLRARRLVAVLALTLLFPLAVGCGSKARATVKGTVQWGGKPLPGGTIAFITADNRSGSGTIDGKGNYVVHDAPIGDAKVCVTLPMAGVGPATKSKMPEGMSMKPPPGMEPKDSGPAPADLRGVRPIPTKYNKPETTPLSFGVKSGENTFPVTLEP